MKISRVSNPGTIRHGLNGNEYNLVGPFYLLEIYNPEDLEAISKDEDIMGKMRKRWTQAFRNFTDEQGARLQYYFHTNRWWNFLMKISPKDGFSSTEFLSFVRFKSGTENNLTKKDAYNLISFLFKGCIDFSTWMYQSAGSYSVLRQNFKIEVVVPPEQYASLQGYSVPKYQYVLDRFHSSGIELKIKKPF